MTDLVSLKRWFRDEWQAELGSGRIHVATTDPGGDPDWNERFRSLMAYPPEASTEMPGDELARMRSFPLRWHLRTMARGGKHGYRRARFLFVLACQDFDVAAAARAVSPAGDDTDGEQWAHDYAVMCLRKLWDMAHDPERTDEGGRPRTFVARRIGKSEAQFRAEEAV